jgi:hypothetical protein
MGRKEDERERKEWKKERAIKRGELVEERTRKEGNARILFVWHGVEKLCLRTG